MAYYHGWFKFNSDVVKFLSLSSCCASYLCGFSAHLHQEAVLDRWGQHQHGQHRWHQPQRPLHQPERPCWWVSGSFLWLYKRQHPLVTGQMITTQSCLFSFPFFFSGLSIDFKAERLYWISSGNSTINRCKLDGSGLEVLEGAKGKLTKATALAIMGRYPECIKTALFILRDTTLIWLCCTENCSG